MTSGLLHQGLQDDWPTSTFQVAWAQPPPAVEVACWTPQGIGMNLVQRKNQHRIMFPHGGSAPSPEQLDTFLMSSQLRMTPSDRTLGALLREDGPLVGSCICVAVNI